MRIRSVKRDQPDLPKLSRALIGFALAQAEAEAKADYEAGPSGDKAPTPPAGGAHEQ